LKSKKKNTTKEKLGQNKSQINNINKDKNILIKDKRKIFKFILLSFFSYFLPLKKEKKIFIKESSQIKNNNKEYNNKNKYIKDIKKPEIFFRNIIFLITIIISLKQISNGIKNELDDIINSNDIINDNITLKIKGIGSKKIYDSIRTPNTIYINGKKQSQISKSYLYKSNQ